MASHNINKDWFDAVLAERGMSQRELCRRLGLDSSAMSLTFRGLRQMKLQEAADIARLLGVPMKDVLENAGIQVDGAGVRVAPVVGYIDAEGEAHIDWDARRDKVPMPDTLPEDSVALIWRASSGNLMLLDGWTFYIDKPQAPSAELINRYCACKVKGGLVLMRWVRRGYKPGTWNLSGIGTVDVDSVRLEWAAPCVLIRP